MTNQLVSDASVEKELPENFLNKVVFEPSCGCWIWVGAHNSTGYANFWHGGKSQTAHRFAYERLYGPQPGLHIDHLCRLPCCVNPDHLEAVTATENNSRRKDLGKGNRSKTHCRAGHALAGSNLEIITLPDGSQKRRCIICRNRNQRAYNARKGAAHVQYHCD